MTCHPEPMSFQSPPVHNIRIQLSCDNLNHQKPEYMNKISFATVLFLVNAALPLFAQDKASDRPAYFENYRISQYVHWYPAIEQKRMMDAWLAENELASWTFSGRVDANDRTVITPQADANYGYSWFNVSNGSLVIEIPRYERYYSLSIFDMHHFVEGVIVRPTKPVVVRLPNQASPIADAHEVVLTTNSGLAFLRMVIPEPKDEAEVMAICREIKNTGGDGKEEFIIPDFSDDERKKCLELINTYLLTQSAGDKMFGKRTQGVGDLDRAAGVFAGQLGIPSTFVQYQQYGKPEGPEKIGGDKSYELTINPKGLFKDEDGYWSVTIYDMGDRYLIPNGNDRYSVTAYNAIANEDGTYTVRMNPKGEGDNAIPTAGRVFYAIMRVYQPNGKISFPAIREVK